FGAYFVTICCDGNAPLLQTVEVGEAVVEELTRTAGRQSFAIVAHCAMPNHLHFLARGRSADSDLVKFVSAFKQKTGFEYQKRAVKRWWQPKYFEHILRKEEDLEGVAFYIWNTPVRAGICEKAIDYPLSGSMIWD